MKKAGFFPGIQFWVTILVVMLGVASFKLWSVPKNKQGVPVVATLDQLVQDPGKFHKRLVMVSNGVVDAPRFFMDRSFFWLSAPKTNAEIFSVSQTFRSEGEPVNNGLFYFEILYSGSDYHILLMREVNS
ncbi:MAG: hypothetical protein NW218_05745 [Saprospiraceae bacterium]|nr:hypothetical protein [Saprospiraceae bacterium]